MTIQVVATHHIQKTKIKPQQPASAYFPPGWSYNPSTWSQRVPIFFLALLGLAVSSYLALYQYDFISIVQEGFIDQSSKTILDSRLANIFGIPNAALASVIYFLEMIFILIGGRRRWQAMPGIVIVLGFLVGFLGVAGIGLTIVQPLLFNDWCTLCLISAVISIVMVGPVMDEVLASLQYLSRGTRGWPREVPCPDIEPVNRKNIAWSQIMTVILGFWLMAASTVLDYSGIPRINDYIVSPLVISFAIIATWDTTRFLRWFNLLLGIWLLLAPVIFDYPTNVAINSIAACGVLIVLSLPRGPINHLSGGGWRSVFRSAEHYDERYAGLP